jgi:hypothetical protein
VFSLRKKLDITDEIQASNGLIHYQYKPTKNLSSPHPPNLLLARLLWMYVEWSGGLQFGQKVGSVSLEFVAKRRIPFGLWSSGV